MKKKKIIYDLTEDVMGVYAISVVEMPAIEANFIALSGKQEVRLKVDNERRMLYGPILIPDKEILRIDKNTGEEYTIEFPAATIEKACHAFLKQGNQGEHTYEHQFKVQGMTVVESWIKEGDNDKSVHFGMDYPVGTWFVGTKVENNEVWNQVKQGSIKGFSIEGEFMPSEESDLLSKLQNVLSSANN